VSPKWILSLAFLAFLRFFFVFFLGLVQSAAY